MGSQAHVGSGPSQVSCRLVHGALDEGGGACQYRIARSMVGTSESDSLCIERDETPLQKHMVRR